MFINFFTAYPTHEGNKISINQILIGELYMSFKSMKYMHEGKKQKKQNLIRLILETKYYIYQNFFGQQFLDKQEITIFG